MRTLQWVALVLVALSMAGCGGNAGSKLDFVPLKGKVTLDGVPLTVGTVTLFPQLGTKGPACSGALNSSGEFAIIGPDGKPGAPVGKHKVCVICPYDPAAGSSPSGEAAPASSGAPCNVPEIYQSEATTTLGVIEVKKPETPPLNLDLKSK